MARIKPKTISWNPSESQDVVAYRVYAKPDDGALFGYDAQHIETAEVIIYAPDDFPEGTFETEGDYLIGVSAVDDAGNESDITEVAHPFDLNPPKPVTGLAVS